MDPLPAPVDELLRRCLAEDVGSGDVTATALVGPELRARARLIAKEPGILAGLEVALRLLRLADPGAAVRADCADGARVVAGQQLAEVEATARGVLAGERTALNLLQRMSGIATLTGRFVEAVAGLPVAILDTRKTAPGLRVLDKWAVRAGGGENHRFGLFDQVLIKENHLARLPRSGAGRPIEEALRRARAAAADLRIEIEVVDAEEAVRAAAAGADLILLDNFSLDELRRAVAAVRGLELPRGPGLEASGGIQLHTVRAVAETGVDRISVGALTHSAPALDITLLIQELDCAEELLP